MPKRFLRLLAIALTLIPLTTRSTHAAEVVLPQTRNAFYASESIEVAIAGLATGAVADIKVSSKDSRNGDFNFGVRGDGSTVTVVLPPFALAPGNYSISVDNQPGPAISIVSGVNNSTYLLSQSQDQKLLASAQGNFVLGGVFGMGLVGPDKQPLKALRSQRSAGMEAFEKAVAGNLPTLLYQYWTGYISHKPWGANKSWAAPEMMEMMRFFNLHTAQRMRRYQKNLVSIGTLDEPGLAYGRTPAGGTASGYPSWDEADWYRARGWDFTNDPAARPDADWIKYVTIRASIIKQNNAWAREDWKALMPSVPFSTDIYAPTALMDGTDPLNQEVNDIPSTHLFADFNYGKLGMVGGIYLEKAHNPEAKVAHAMNGQLMGGTDPQPNQTYNYRLAQNALFAAGSHSNWWLNFGAMSNEALASVNEPAQRLGPLFMEMTPTAGKTAGPVGQTGHDVAILWSFTELSMRLKDITAKEASKKDGEQLKLLIAVAPELELPAKSGQVDVSAYSVGGNYAAQVLTAHQALLRAGYPAHILHEKLLSRGALRNYKTLVIIGQTFALPLDVQRALAAFVAGGGQIVTDKTSTVSFPGAIVTNADFKDPYYRLKLAAVAPPPGVKADKASSYVQTNFFVDEPARRAAPLMKATMQKTRAIPVITTDSPFLGTERHTGGEGALLMVLNGFEQLPERTPEQPYPIYNHAPFQTNFQFQGLRRNCVVYLIEGGDWKRASRVENPLATQKVAFEPGEMKLYLVAPRAPSGLDLQAGAGGGALAVRVRLKNLKMPWPLTISIQDPAGTEMFHVYRSTDSAGQWSETFPLGTNAENGAYQVRISSPAADLAAQRTVAVGAMTGSVSTIAGKVRVFDATAIENYLAQKPAFTIALGSPAQAAVAQKLAQMLTMRGIATKVVPEAQLIQKVRYPRVWDPYITVYQLGDKDMEPSGEVKTRVTVENLPDGRLVATTPEGEDAGTSWWKPNTLITVGPHGYAQLGGFGDVFYEAGVKIYLNAKTSLSVLNGIQTSVKSTPEVREKWSRPWTKLTPYGASFSLTPQLPEAYKIDSPLILLGDSNSGELTAALQASELLPQIADEKYPGSGKALVEFAWSPFALGKNVVFIGASDPAGLEAGAAQLAAMAARP